MPQELNHGESLEERVVKDDFLLFLGETRCEPKSVVPKPVFLVLTLKWRWGLVREKNRELIEGHRKGRFGATTVSRL